MTQQQATIAKVDYWSVGLFALAYNIALWSAVAAAVWWTDRPWLWGSCVFLFFVGAAVGSFANQAAYRIPRRMKLDDPPSSCPKCLTQIRRRDNIPIVSWILLRGRCRICHTRISKPCSASGTRSNRYSPRPRSLPPKFVAPPISVSYTPSPVVSPWNYMRRGM